jgi:hypothetical protein
MNCFNISGYKMNNVEESIKKIISLLKKESLDDVKFELKNVGLNTRIKLAKEAILLEHLCLDSSKYVRLEVAKHGFKLELLKSDFSWEVKLEVYKQTNLEYMKFKNIYKEDVEIQKEAIRKGDIEFKNDMLNNLELCKILVEISNKNEITKIFNGTKFKEIEELCVKNGHDCNSEQIVNLLKNWDFRIWCIENDRFISKIFIHFKSSMRTLVALLKNGYKNYEHSNENVLNTAIDKNSQAVINWMIDSNEHLIVKDLINDIESIKKLIEVTANKEVLEYIIKNKSKEVSSLADYKLNHMLVDSKFKNIKKL